MNNITCTKEDEEVKLKKQIQYLTDLINNADKRQSSSSESRGSTQRLGNRHESKSFCRGNPFSLYSSSVSKNKSLEKDRFVWKKNLSSGNNTLPVVSKNIAKPTDKNIANVQSKLPVSRSSSGQQQFPVYKHSFGITGQSYQDQISQKAGICYSTRFSLRKETTVPQGKLPIGKADDSRKSNYQKDFTFSDSDQTIGKTTKYKFVKDLKSKSVAGMPTTDVKIGQNPKNLELIATIPTSELGKSDMQKDIGSCDSNKYIDKSLKIHQDKSTAEAKVEISKTSVLALSPSKKEAVEQLNKQILVTTNKIQQLKKNLSQNIQTNQRTGATVNVPQKTIPKKTSNFKHKGLSYVKHSPVLSSPSLGVSPFPAQYGSKSQANSFSSSQTQMVADVIKSKYRLRKFQMPVNKVKDGDMNINTKFCSEKYIPNLNMKMFYKKMAKKYGWTNLNLQYKRNLNMKIFYKKMAKKYGWTNLDLKNSGCHTHIGKKKLKVEKSSRGHGRTVYSYKSFVNRKDKQNSKLPHASRLKLDRRKLAPKPLVNRARKGTHFVLLNGVLYNSNRTSMVKTTVNRSNIGTSLMPTLRSKVRNKGYGASGKVKRHFTFVRNYVTPSGPGVLKSSGWNTRVLASKAINRSIATATAKYRKDNTKQKSRQYCMFYNRFGKCNRGDNCPYVHDPERIAICTRFLRGTCKVLDCPFSHKVAKEKMPVCSYFLRGVCNRDSCPYLHVNVSKNASVCPDFLSGFCSLGEKCKMKHTRFCPEFAANGTCSNGEKCQLIHVKKEKRKKRKSLSKSTSIQGQENKISPSEPTNLPKKRKVESMQEVDDDPRIPFKYRKLPTFISLDCILNDKESLDDKVPKPIKELPGIRIEKSEKTGIRIKPQL